MAGSNRFEIDGVLNASGIAKGAHDGAMALADLEDAIGDVAAESSQSGGKVDSFASKLIDAARKAGKSDAEIKDSLRNMGYSAKQAETAIERIGDEFTKTGREGDRAADKLEDALKDVQRQSKKTADEVDDIGGKSFGKMGDAAQEVTQEIGQNLGETVSSMRGNLSDLGQIGQDTLGGLAATLSGAGPAGIAGAAAVAAGAVGLGLITAENDKINASVQAMKGYFADAWKEAVQGGRDYIDAATVIGEMNDIIFNPDRAEDYKRIQEDANTLGLETNLLLKAAAGDQDALNVVMGRSAELVEEQNKLVTDSADIRTRGRGAQEAAASQELADLQTINDRWKQYGDINDENRQKAQDAARATSDYLKSLVADYEDAAVSVDALGNRMIELPDGTTFYVDAQTGEATEQLDSFEGDADGIIDRLNGKQITLRLATEDALRAAQTAAAQIGGIPDKTVKVTADTSSVDAALRRIQNTAIIVAAQVATSTAAKWE